MLRSNSSQPSSQPEIRKQSGSKTLVDGRTIPYTRSGRIFGNLPLSVQNDTRFVGEALFHASGWNTQQSYSWTVPADNDITYISVVSVGGGGSGEMGHDGASGGGGALAYKNDIPVSPGTSVTVYVGGGGSNPNGSPNSTAYPGEPSYIRIAGVNYAIANGGTGATGNESNPPIANVPGGTYSNADGGGSGGAGCHSGTGVRMGGGGAGGYTGNGGNAGYTNGYSVPNHPGNPSPGNGGGGGGGNSINGGSTGGGGGVGMYGEGTSGSGGPTAGNWYDSYGRGGSTAYNTGLNSYMTNPPTNPISSMPLPASGGTNYAPGFWGTVPPGSGTYNLTRSDGPAGTRLQGDGGFPGGGGAGGNSSDYAGRGAHGMVRIVYGYNGPKDNANKRIFPNTHVDRSDQYAANVNPDLVTIDDVNGQQLMY